jgi:hypothetical protein
MHEMTPELPERVLIDDQGHLCGALPEVVEMLLDYPDADFDITAYAVRNLGWIEISLDQPAGKIEAKFRALTVSFGALSGLYALLSNSDWKAIQFEYDLFGWMTETYDDSGTASAALRVVVRSVIDFFHHPPYTAVEKNPASLHEEDNAASKTLASVLEFWRERGGRIPENLTAKLRDIGILPRLMLIDVDSSGSAGRFQYIGSGFTIYGDRWPREAIGQNIQEQPDQAYAARVVDSCMMAALSSSPSYTHVDACIAMPEQKPRRSRYKCLKTPWTNSRGDRVLMITSVLTPDVDIPLILRAA